MADINWLKKIVTVHKFHVELTYSRITNWYLTITRRGSKAGGGDLIVFDGQDSDLSLLLAKAEVAVKEYCTDNLGGY